MTTLRIEGGRVLLPDLTVEASDVLVDREAGTVEAVGDPDEVAGSDDPADETLDASGGLVMPGLINAHTHVSMTLLRGYADDKPLDAWLQEDIWPMEAHLTEEDVRVGAELGVLEMIRSGTTTFCDMYFHMPAIAEVVGEAGLRATLGRGAVTVGKDDEAAREDLEAGLDFAAEYDDVADGRVRTAFMPHSLTTVGGEYLDEFLPRARELEVPIHFHANETADEAESIVAEHDERPLTYARARGLLEPEDFLAHGVHLDGTEVDLLAETGAGVVHCPASNMKLASGMAPVQRLLDAGVAVGLGTDGAASNNDLDLFDEVRDAAMVGKLAADDASAVPAEAAVGLATSGGADVLGVDAGRIEPGAFADLVVVDLEAPHLTPHHDLVSHLAYAARGSDVRHTVCDGEVLMRGGEVLTLEEDAVLERAERRARDLLSRVEVD